MKKEKTFTFLDITIVVIITALVMYFLGGMVVYRHLGGIYYNRLSEDQNLKEFISAYNGILQNYYDDLDKDTLIKGAIDGMYSKIDDPYTNYLNESNTNSLNDSLNGKYSGIGVRIATNKDNQIYIYEVFDDSPASKAGLQKGDIFVSINGKSTEGMDSSELASIIKGSGNEEVTIGVLRDTNTLTFKLKISSMMVPVIDSKLLERDGHKVGYIKLTVFNDTADTQFESALSTLENSGMESLIIDLRNNSGGYLEVCKNIAEMFIEKNKLIYSLENKTSKTDYYDKTSEKRNYKIAIIVNKGSASASEILTGALKYSYGATVFGETSYGKGKVQERANLSGGDTVKFTTAKWLMPNGECIDGIGISPDYPAALDESVYNSEDIYSDTQVLYTLKRLAD